MRGVEPGVLLVGLQKQYSPRGKQLTALKASERWNF